MDSTLNPTQKTHIVWLDVVRLVAMFTVVCCHSADPFNFYPGEPPEMHFITSFYAYDSLYLTFPTEYLSLKRLI